MKIHTSVLTADHFYAALKATAPGVFFAELRREGSRSRTAGFNVLLESDGTPDKDGTPRRRARNRGKGGYDGHPGFAASYDDWGRFLAALFLVDPDAIAGPYKGYDDFHAQTKGAYA